MKKLLLVVPCFVIACANDLHVETFHEPGADEDGSAVVIEADDELSADGVGVARESPFAFVRLGLRFTSDDVDAVEVRTSVDGLAWSEWTAPTIVFSEEAAHAGHVDADASSRFFQHRVMPDREVPTFLVLEPIAELGDAPADGEVEIAASTASTEEQGLNLAIISRGSWGARAPRCRDGTGVTKATVHHTAGANDDRTPVSVQLRQIQAFHMFTRGWCDIAYNFLVSRDGRVFEGRGYGVLGAHVENDNTNNMGVNFIGTYESVAPPVAQQIAGAKVLRYLHDRGGIPLSRDGVNGVKGHRQRGTTATSCPGARLYGLLGAIVQRAARKDFDAPPTGPCATHNFDGAFCDDENSGAEAAHNRLKTRLDVDFHCANKEGSPAYCGTADATRKDAIFVFGAAADMPTRGHPDAFPDDEGKREGWFNAAKAFGIIGGINGRAAPDVKISRSSTAVILARMYHLPATDRDYFDDDDGSSAEGAHNRVAAAGLMNGSADGGGRRDFKPRTIASRSDLAVLAGRAIDARLRAVWNIPEGCRSGAFDGAFCDDDDTNGEDNNDALVAAGVVMPWLKIDGKPLFEAAKEASRAATIYMLTQAAGIPLEGHPDAFVDDNDHDRERWFNAAKAFGIIGGFAGGTEMRPTSESNRDTVAIVLARMYALPDSDVDAFSDDDGTNMEPWHNKMAAAGLMDGYPDGDGGREFRGAGVVTRGVLSTMAARVRNAGLVPIWDR
ncbi:MAG: peptidoglycan recognition protein [Deltaproteobacteria bacterium]|nr:peptidoglycan recognition protein [Deltaproteobacteria bacterium]